MDLIQFLASSCLNEASSMEVYINPHNINDYQVWDHPLEGYISIGTLDQLSFGYQSEEDAVYQALGCVSTPKEGEKVEILFEGKKISINPVGIMRAYTENKLGDAMQKWLEKEVRLLLDQWAEEEATLFVEEKLPIILDSLCEVC